MNAHINHDMPIACDLTVLEPAVRATHVEAATQLLCSAAAEVAELADGYAFRYGTLQSLCAGFRAARGNPHTNKDQVPQ